METPRIIKGGIAVDDRGRVMFCNDFDMSRVKRFYMLENHQEGFVRAWHGHIEEAKWVCVVSGVALVRAFKFEINDNFPYYVERSGHQAEIYNHGNMTATLGIPKTFTLHPNGDVLYIPPGYANGHVNIVSGTRVLHFSDKTMEEAEKDDYRFDAGIHGWVWEVKER